MSFEVTLIANPENRRATMFVDAVAQRGGVCHVLPWVDVFKHGVRPECGANVRIESFGENWEVESWLLQTDRPEDVGRIEGLERVQTRFMEVLRTFPPANYMTEPSDILAMFDKVESKARMERAGLSPPRTYGRIRTFDALVEVLRTSGRRRAFVKPRHGSSASGVIALTMDEVRVTATTSVEVSGGRVYNSLKLSRYGTHAELAKVVDLLGREDELIVEEWVPKSTTVGGAYDLRIVPIGGVAQHVVVRVSKSPMTNLHLGNARGDSVAIQAHLGETWGRVCDVARRAVSAFPSALYAGVDIGITPDRRRITPFEVNAFGDLLPRVTDAAGRDTYLAEVDAFMSR